MTREKDFNFLSDFLNFEIYATPEKVATDVFDAIQNEQKTLIVYQKTSLKNDHLAFLGKIMNAVKFDLEQDVVLLGLDNEQSVDFQALYRAFEIDYVLLFGILPRQLQLNFRLPLYYPLKIGSIQFLMGDDLGKIEKNVQKKKALWGSLQQLFLK